MWYTTSLAGKSVREKKKGDPLEPLVLEFLLVEILFAALKVLPAFQTTNLSWPQELEIGM